MWAHVVCVYVSEEGKQSLAVVDRKNQYSFNQDTTGTVSLIKLEPKGMSSSHVAARSPKIP